MATAPPPPLLASFLEAGALGVVGLKRLWSRFLSRSAASGDDIVREWRAARVLCAGLEIGVEEFYRHLGSAGLGFADLEAWIAQRNGGSVAPAIVARINAALTGQPVPADTRALLNTIDAMDPVLDADALAHWDEHGWVILHDAISDDACRSTAQAVWDTLGKSPDDPAGWEAGTDQQQCVFTNLFRHPALDANRRSPRIHKALAQLWGTADLWVTTDRVGFNPPVTPRCGFPGPGIHWDVSLAQPVPLGIQGLVYLTDTAADQGAFALVPGMHRTLGAWLEALPAGASPREHAERHLTMTPIAGRAGDLILWHHALAHGPTPNRTDRPRLVHYITMFPADFGYQTTWL